MRTSRTRNDYLADQVRTRGTRGGLEGLGGLGDDLSFLWVTLYIRTYNCCAGVAAHHRVAAVAAETSPSRLHLGLFLRAALRLLPLHHHRSVRPTQFGSGVVIRGSREVRLFTTRSQVRLG